MSVARAQREISSPEYAEWMAFYILEAEESDPDRPPTPDELDAKMRGIFGGMSAGRPGAVTQVPR